MQTVCNKECKSGVAIHHDGQARSSIFTKTARSGAGDEGGMGVAIGAPAAERDRRSEAVTNVQAQIDWLGAKFLKADGEERTKLTLQYMRLKEELAELTSGG
jgi:hypothetical protein